jgi:hypothetical protein
MDTLGILSPRELEALRAGYNRKMLLALAPQLVAYSKLAPETSWIAQAVYAAPPNSTGPSGSAGPPPAPTCLTPWEREIVVLSLAMAKRDLFTMPAHLYWALMELLEHRVERPVEKLADVIMTAGTYSGIDDARWGISVLNKLLSALGTAVTKNLTTTQQLLVDPDTGVPGVIPQTFPAI